MNRLSASASPYLLQHAHNPVPWWEWGPEAFEEAERTDRPILLSVGYAACHWCHVMERESFEDPAIGALMGQLFVNIKVDREERPDVDDVYMRSVQLLQNGQGGWPMTVFLTPDRKPFWGGTYFPPESRHGMPSFRSVLERMARLWTDHRATVISHADELVEALRRGARSTPTTQGSSRMMLEVANGVRADFDSRFGGFGGAPKFPPHGTLAVLAANAALQEHNARDMLVRTLDGMCRGGMYDLVEGGFARYSVDAEWRVPHFEKMLYDQAQLVPVLVDTSLITGDTTWALVAEETLAFVAQRLSLPDGGFSASTDADTDGDEGLTFTWTPSELQETLGADCAEAARLFSVTQEGTFEHGRSVLRLCGPRSELSPTQKALLSRVRPVLAATRAQRIQPGLDDKAVAAWNAAMGSAFVRAGTGLNKPEYVARGVRVAEFLYGPMSSSGRLHRSWRQGRLGPFGFADDVAARCTLALDLFEATGNSHWLVRSLMDADDLVTRFWDGTALRMTASDGEALVVTLTNPVGHAEPSAVGMVSLVFTRLAALCDRQDLGEIADALIRARTPYVSGASRAIGVEAIASSWREIAGRVVVITGQDSAALARVVHEHVNPHQTLAWLPNGPDPLVPSSRGKTAQVATAWVCTGSTCQAPQTQPAGLHAQLMQPFGHTPTSAVPAPSLPVDGWVQRPPDNIERSHADISVLLFFSTTRVHATHVAAAVQSLLHRFAHEPVAFLAVHVPSFGRDRVTEETAVAVRRLGLPIGVLHDADGAVASAWGVSELPAAVVVNGAGHVCWRHDGALPTDTIVSVLSHSLAGAGLPANRVRTLQVTTEVAGDNLHFPEKLHATEDMLWVADTGAHRLLRFRLNEGDDGWPVATNRAAFGGPRAGFVDGDKPMFHHPRGLTLADGALWVADTGNHAIRRLDLASFEVRTVAGNGQLGRGGRVDPARPKDHALISPWDMTGNDDALFVAMAGDHRLWVLLPREGRFGPYAGNGTRAHADGDLSHSSFAEPTGVALSDGWLFAIDSATGQLRAVDLTERRVGTVAIPEHAVLQHPHGLAVHNGVAVVADTLHGKLVRIDLASGAVDTLATGLAGPRGVTLWHDFALVADTDAHRLVAVRTDGRMRVLVS